MSVVGASLVAVTSDKSGGAIPYGRDEGAGSIPDGTAQGTMLVGPSAVDINDLGTLKLSLEVTWK